MLCGLERDESGLVVCARVGDETQWLFAGKADAKSWNDAGSQLLRDGYAVIHGFLGANLALALREQARQKFEAQGHEAFEHINADFARHGLCSTRLTELDVDDSSVSFMPHLTRQGESLVRHLAHESVTELRAVVGRSRPMLAVYPGEGARYMRHVDNPGGNGRLLTLVYYLNFGWREREHGGCLRLWRADYSEPVATMAPLLDRAVLFWSDRRVPHEVMPAQRERIATQIWFHDDEQAAPQDDAEYLATLKSLTNALHRRSHVEVRTIDHALSAALAAMSTGSTTAGGGSEHGTYTVTAHEPSADVVAPCLAWLRRLGAVTGAVGNKDADGQEREPAEPVEPVEPVDVRVECLAANGEARWHTWPDDEHADTHAVVLVQLRTTGGDGVVGGASVHCEPERSSGGWPRVDDAPVLLESTPGEGAVFLHVFLVGTAPLRLRLDHVELLAIHVRWKGEGG